MNLDFGRCQVYKLNISACLTERELDYYNLFCDGITRKELKKRLGVDYPTSEMLSEEFHISLEDAADLLKAQMNKKCFRKFLTDEIEKFSPNEVREIRKSAIYVADEEGNLTDRIKDNKKIVWFGNECVRRCNVDLKDIPLLDQFLLLKCGSKALTGVLNQIVERGVNLDGKHYLFYTSTTGQMKETEITLVEEEYWKENEYALMCGLTEERINSKGGINMGKYFAAKALNLSNSIKYDSGISIDEVIIVPDFKTFVSGMVNYLDVNTLDIQEKKMEIEIEHMDGAGIFIPGTFPCSCQIRGGWLKGAVFPFDFHKFIEKYRDKVSAANMIDAWGNPVTVEEFLNAKMILTDSQLKMRKYYDSMQEYRKCFKKAKLSITVNNCAHQAKSEVKVAYQPFQTIPRDNLTDETIKKLADKTVRYIEDAKKNPKAALQLMGIEIDSEDMEDKMKDVEMNVLHAAILKYPQLLNDIHVQKIMKSVLLSERRKAQGCKLVLDGFWSYICPDLYAFCQWLFLGQDVPEGLVPNGYIYNHYYNDKEIEETCCLRYPHLSDCEHGIRKVLQSKECEEWFNGTDTIVSSHDLISKVLQADWDGDHICLVHDKAFMDVLERDKYPLFYDMTKAESAQITNNAVMNCLISSFQNENIGFVSNAITKIFNSEGDPDTKLVRVLCAYNNFVIDYFKTQKSMDLQGIIYSLHQILKSNCVVLGIDIPTNGTILDEKFAYELNEFSKNMYDLIENNENKIIADVVKGYSHLPDRCIAMLRISRNFHDNNPEKAYEFYKKRMPNVCVEIMSEKISEEEFQKQYEFSESSKKIAYSGRAKSLNCNFYCDSGHHKIVYTADDNKEIKCPLIMHYDGNISISAYCSRCHWNENVVGNVFDGKSLREMITEWNYRTPLTCDEACELEEFRMLNDLKEKSERRDFYSKIGEIELSEEKIEKATFGKEFEIFYLENYRLKLHERVPTLTTDEIENISIYALDLVRTKKEMSEEEYKNAQREIDIEISRMAFEHLYDDVKEVHEILPYLTPEECQEWLALKNYILNLSGKLMDKLSIRDNPIDRMSS